MRTTGPTARHVQPVAADVYELTWSTKSSRRRANRNPLIEEAGSRDQRDSGNEDAELVDVRHHHNLELSRTLPPM